MYALTRSLAMVLGIVIGGVLIDVDHFIEHFSFRGIRLNVKEMFYLCYYNLYPKLYLLLHSYELVTAAWITAALIPGNTFIMGFAIGITVHMVCDQIFNPVRTFTYFFIFRAIHRFEGDSIRLPGSKGSPATPLFKRKKKDF